LPIVPQLLKMSQGRSRAKNGVKNGGARPE
jgi:hypothetical protein